MEEMDVATLIYWVSVKTIFDCLGSLFFEGLLYVGPDAIDLVRDISKNGHVCNVRGQIT